MAAGTNGKVIAAERPLTIMTRHATHDPSRRMMIEGLGCCHLSSLWHSRSHLMTFVAVNLLMFCMTKTDAKRLREFGRSRIAAQLMTGAAGRNIAAAGFRARRMTTVASCMGVKAGWYGERDATSRWAVTGRAANAAHTQMARVIEFHSKTTQTRKGL